MDQFEDVPKESYTDDEQKSPEQKKETLRESKELEEEMISPKMSLMKMRNSNEITHSIQFGEMRVSSEIRKKNDEMFFSKDESFFRNINNSNALVFDKMFEKKEKKKPEITQANSQDHLKLLEKVENITIKEAQENENTDDEKNIPQGPSPKNNHFYDFDLFQKKSDSKKEIIAVEESTQMPILETQESEEIDHFQNLGNFPKIEIDNNLEETSQPFTPGGNFTKRKSAFHPNKVKSMNDKPVQKEIEMTNFGDDSQQSVEKNKQFSEKKHAPGMNVASITSLGASSYLKKDFTKDKILMQKGYSQNLLRAMNQYSMVLDHIKSVQKNQVDPYKNVKSIFELKNVHKTYLVGLEGVPAIRGIDLKIYEGEFLMIYGKSGGGKSSLLNLIGTIDEPNKGSIQMENQGFLDCLKDAELSKIRMNNIGFVFQSFNLINSLTALENIKLPMLLQGKMSAKQAHERALSLMEELSISHRKDSYPKQMSGGEQQRVTIARAVSNKPKMLLLDEPTGDLDSKNSLIVMKILMELNIKEKITMIMVTHDEHIKDLANRIVYVIDGKINKCVVNAKEKRREIVDKLLLDAQAVKEEMKKIKLRDAHEKETIKPRKIFRNPIHHPFFKHLANKASR